MKVSPDSANNIAKVPIEIANTQATFFRVQNVHPVPVTLLLPGNGQMFLSTKMQIPTHFSSTIHRSAMNFHSQQVFEVEKMAAETSSVQPMVKNHSEDVSTEQSGKYRLREK